jgi:hypothetical protein
LNLQNRVDSLTRIVNLGENDVIVSEFQNPNMSPFRYTVPINSTVTWGVIANYSGYIYARVDTPTTTNAFVLVTYTSSDGTSTHPVHYSQETKIDPNGGWASFPVLPSSNLEVTVGNMTEINGLTIEKVTIVYYY